MDQLLREFFDQERQRIFKPTPEFCRSVMVRLGQQVREPQTVSEMLLGTTRPILALALIVLVVLISMETIVSVEPNRGPTQIYIESEIPNMERVLYLDTQTPSTTVVLEQLISESN